MTAIQGTDRADRLVAMLPEAGIDLLLVTDLTNLRYLTGYVGSNAIAVIGPDTRTFATDFRYAVQIEEQVDRSFERRELPRDLPSAVEGVLPPGEIRLGFENSMPVRIHTRLREVLPERVELVAVDGLIERLRVVKDAGEVERMRAAAELADRALEQLLSEGLVGRRERDVALALEVAIRKLGAERVSFEPIVAAGPQGAMAHAIPSDSEIPPGKLVVIDWGAQLDGYCSDCTRTIATGEIDDHAREVYEIVLRAQMTGVEAIRAGAVAAKVDAKAREVIDAAGYGEQFGHSLGHGVGLNVHEAPRLGPSAEDELVPGNVVTVEPGIYLPGELGVRIEDLVVVTGSGCEILTSLPKELTVIG
jgi:Xaa-Pro aminopeptidase